MIDNSSHFFQRTMHRTETNETEIWRINNDASTFIPLPPSTPSFSEIDHQQIDEKSSLEQISNLKKQISDSESNLKAQESALNSTKQAKAEALWKLMRKKQVDDLIKQVGLNMAGFERLVEHMQTSGSKETISNSKKWIFENCSNDRLREVVLIYLLHRVKDKIATDAFRLHILYLINDWSHYCQRKKFDSVQKMLSRYVPRLFSYAISASNLDNSIRERLEKLVTVWQTNSYFDQECYQKLNDFRSVMNDELIESTAELRQATQEIEAEIVNTLQGYERQHREYEQHMLAQISEIEASLIRKKVGFISQASTISNESPHMSDWEQNQQKIEQDIRRRSRFDQPPPTAQKIPSLLDTMTQAPPPHVFYPNPPPPPLLHAQKLFHDNIPKGSYYDLPAGMMVPLVKPDDITYKPLREQDLRIPSPTQPSEQLLYELERFYNPLSETNNPRDSDGWEPNGLLDHYLKKAEYRVKLEAKLKSEGKTLEDVITNRYIRDPLSNRSRSSSPSSSSSSDSNSSSESSSSSPNRTRSDRSRSNSPDERPSFVGSNPAQASLSSINFTNSVQFKMPALPLDREQNRGAQLMAKMGWEGKGLGVNEQGREDPIEVGEPREKIDKYKGVGLDDDIYDNFRKQMSQKKAGRF